jgi:hypothetical protein
MNYVQKINRAEFVDPKISYNFYSVHFSVGRVSMIASPSEKEEVRGFDGTLKEFKIDR